jgi:DNA-binding response OmpR family regulator
MKTCGSDPLSRPKAELGLPFGSSSSADVPSSGTSAETPIRPEPASRQQREIEIDTLSTPGLAGPAQRPGPAPTWLVLADTGQEVLGDASTGVATVALGSTFVRLLRELRPALAVVWSPPAAPVELLAAVAERRQRPALRLIFLNEPGDVAGRLEALALGFDEALPASVDPVELAGRAYLLVDPGRHGSDPARHIPVAHDVQLDLVARRVRRRDVEVHLRPKEFALLALLATDPGRVFSRDELVDRIWGPTYAGGPRTVDVHIRWLRAKIEEDPARPIHVMTVRGTGYRLDPPEA